MAVITVYSEYDNRALRRSYRCHANIIRSRIGALASSVVFRLFMTIYGQVLSTLLGTVK